MARKRYTREFELSAVKLVNKQGYSVPGAARSLGVDPNCVRGWVQKFGAEGGSSPAAKASSKPSCGGCGRRTRGC